MSTATAVKSPKPFLIGDEWIKNTPECITSINPATGEVNYEVCAATIAHIDAAVKIAGAAAAKPAWRNMLPHVRAQLLHKFADVMMAHSDELARCQMVENGKVWKECKAQVVAAAGNFRYFASACETLCSEVTPSRGNYLVMTVYEPVGVVAAITPWNSPLTLTTAKLAAALAAGNAVILKPSSITPTCSTELGRVALEAGLPPGIVNVLPGLGSKIGDTLVKHPGVKMVSFTGGTEVGKRIAKLAAERLIPVGLELGGKSPHIVFADANLAAAADAATIAIFEGSGQSCIAGSRLFVERKVMDEVLSLIVERTRALRVDLPDAEGAQLGPIATFAQRDYIESIVATARQEGGKILIGGARPSDPRLEKGAFYLPTIVTGLSNKSTAAQREIFGPVLVVLPFDNEEDLIEQMNDTVYGLASGIWTADYKRAWRIARAMEAGTVWINTYKQLSIAAPFGGFKESGLGREKGLQGVRNYQEMKSIYFSMSAAFDGGFTIAK
jgi:betaine-aldehyde dehydrogenase